jgi:glutamine amidotransferase
MDVAIIKYNAGNIYSVSYALKRLGVEATITADPELLCKADKVIFPGVGEAHTTMEHLKEHNLDTIIKGLKQPVLGICLGMQLMCRHSEEGDANCLGIFDTEVKRFTWIKFRTWDGTRLRTLKAGCSTSNWRTSLFISYIVIMYP